MSSFSIRSWLPAVLFVLVSIGQAMAGRFNTNLVVNGDAESVPAANQSVNQFDGWVLDGIVSIRAYGSGSFPGINSPGPTSRGNNFFYGGNAATALDQCDTLHAPQSGRSSQWTKHTHHFLVVNT